MVRIKAIPKYRIRMIIMKEDIFWSSRKSQFFPFFTLTKLVKIFFFSVFLYIQTLSFEKRPLKTVERWHKHSLTHQHNFNFHTKLWKFCWEQFTARELRFFRGGFVAVWDMTGGWILAKLEVPNRLRKLMAIYLPVMLAYETGTIAFENCCGTFIQMTTLINEVCIRKHDLQIQIFKKR